MNAAYPDRPSVYQASESSSPKTSPSLRMSLAFTISSVSKSFSNLFISSSQSLKPEEDTWASYGLNPLHAPPETLLDIIFVHGLRGGSIRTWCKGDDRRLFWPKSWLPRETDFQDVRFHSFGHNAEWADTKKTSLNIHDFGRSLLGEMITSPHLRHDRRTLIILLGHSMGGLVIKKVCCLTNTAHRLY
ncbi:hypothetical protein F4778DRAFT_758557 [Xylariomycetidae sp. FL2044]|nr:hypothetical protein F4778DRAFT_758557 [Xylariomycetidae sp. FL2044]